MIGCMTNYKKINLFLLVYWLFVPCVLAEPALPKKVPYLAAEASTFNLTLQQLLRGYNLSNSTPVLPLFKQVHSPKFTKDSLYYVGVINDDFYISLVLDSASQRIKTFQMTYVLGLKTSDQCNLDTIKTSIDDNSLNYMSVLLRWLNPELAVNESIGKVAELLCNGRGLPFYHEIDKSLRYVVADHGEKGITLAIEPVNVKKSDK